MQKTVKRLRGSHRNYCNYFVVITFIFNRYSKLNRNEKKNECETNGTDAAAAAAAQCKDMLVATMPTIC